MDHLCSGQEMVIESDIFSHPYKILPLHIPFSPVPVPMTLEAGGIRRRKNLHCRVTASVYLCRMGSDLMGIEWDPFGVERHWKYEILYNSVFVWVILQFHLIQLIEGILSSNVGMVPRPSVSSIAVYNTKISQPIFWPSRISKHRWPIIFCSF